MDKHDDPIKLSFRHTSMVVGFLALCIACILSLAIVLLLLNYVYQGPITQMVIVVTGTLICVLSIIIGSLLFWKASGWIAKPIEALDTAVKKVSQGDFDVAIRVNNPKVNHHEIHTEVTTLVSNFNLMTKELKSMEYMSKDFMSNVSHEIKTPISTITGITEMILDEGVESEEHRDYIRMVNESSERIADLCDNMLKVSKLDYQQIIDRKDLIRLDEQIRKAAIIALENYPDKEREFSFALDPITYQCDANLMMQVWVNLIENAIKYSPDHSVITINLKNEDQHINVNIHNDGDTIPSEKLRRMFDRFYQCDLSHKDHGNGLGLSIVSRIIKLHEGNIYCQSQGGEGVTMHLELS